MSVVLSRLIQQGGVVSGGPSSIASTYTAMRAISNPNSGDLCIYLGTGIGDHGEFSFNASPVGAARVAVQSPGSGYPVSPGRGDLVNADGHGTDIDWIIDDDGTLGQVRIHQIAAGATAYTTDTIDVTFPDTAAQLTIDPCASRAVVGDAITITIGGTPTTFTYVASGATGTQVNLGTTFTTDQQNLASVITANLGASVTVTNPSGLSTAVTQIVAKTAGTAFNANSVSITQVDDVHPWRMTNPMRVQQITSSSPASLNFGGGGTGGVIRCYRDNGATHIVPGAGSEPRGRWERRFRHPVMMDARWHGFSINNADNTAAIMAADSCSWYANNILYLPGYGGNSQAQGVNYLVSGRLILGSAVHADAVILTSYNVTGRDCVSIFHSNVSKGPRGWGLTVTASRNPGAVVDDGAALAIAVTNFSDIAIATADGQHISTGLKYLCFEPRNGVTGPSEYFGRLTANLCAGNRSAIHVTQTHIQRSIDDGNSLRRMESYIREVNGRTPGVADRFAFLRIDAPGARLPTASATLVSPKLDSNIWRIGDLETSGVTVDEYHAVEIFSGVSSLISCERFDTGPGPTAGNNKRMQSFAVLYVCPQDTDCYNNVFKMPPDLTGSMSRTSIPTASLNNTLWVEPPDPSVQPAIRKFYGCAVMSTDDRVPNVHAVDVSFKNNIIGWGTGAAQKFVVPGMHSSLDGYVGKSFSSTARYGRVEFTGGPGRGPLTFPYVKVDTSQFKTMAFAVMGAQCGGRSIYDVTTRPAQATVVIVMFDDRGRLIPSGGTSGAASGGYANAKVFADSLVLAVDDIVVTTVRLRTFIWRCITAGTTNGAQVPTYPNPLQTSGTAVLEFCTIQGADVSCDRGLNFQQGGVVAALAQFGIVTFSKKVAEVWFCVANGAASGLYIAPLDTSNRGPFEIAPAPAYNGWMLTAPTFGNFSLGQFIPNATLGDTSGWTCVTAGWLAYDAWTTGTAYVSGALVSSGGNIFACVAGASKIAFTGPAAGADVDTVVYDVISLGSAASVTVSANPGGFTATYDIKRVVPAPLGYSAQVDTIGTLSITSGGVITLTLSGATPYLYEDQILRLTRTDGNGAYTATITFHYCSGNLSLTDTVPLSTVDPNTISGMPADRLVGSDGFVWKSLGAQAVLSPSFAGYWTKKVTGTTDAPVAGDDRSTRWLTNASACTVTLPQISTMVFDYSIIIYQDRTAPNPTITPNAADSVSGSVTWGVNVAYRYTATGATTWTATKVI